MTFEEEDGDVHEAGPDRILVRLSLRPPLRTGPAPAEAADRGRGDGPPHRPVLMTAMRTKRHATDRSTRNRLRKPDHEPIPSPFGDPEMLALAWTLSISGGRIPLLP